MDKKSILKNKRILLISILSLILVLSAITVGYNYYGIGMSKSKKVDKIEKILLTKDYTKARKYAVRLFSSKSDKENLNSTLDLINLYEELKISSPRDIANEAEKALNGIIESGNNNIQILDTQAYKNDARTPNRVNEVCVTLKNVSSKNIEYVKVNIQYLDANNNKLGTDFIESNEIILSNGIQSVSKRVPNNMSISKVEASISTFRYN